MRLAVTAFAMLLTLTSLPAAAQAPGTAAVARPATLFVIRYRPGPAWIAGRPVQEQNLRAHAAYVGRLLAEGKVFAGGPFTDADGGMAILWAADRAEADAILAADPAQRDGIMIGEITAWVPYFDSGRPLQRSD